MPGKPNSQTLFLVSVVVLSIVAIGYFGFAKSLNGQARRRADNFKSSLTEDDIPFDGKAAMEWVEKICEIGPRFSGSEGMQKQQEMLVPYFQELGGKVELQKFDVRHPIDGSRVSMANLVVRWHPERKKRILLCAHYDLSLIHI